MVDAFMSGSANDDGWNAMPAASDASANQLGSTPMMAMQAQDGGEEDVFADAAIPTQSPIVTI